MRLLLCCGLWAAFLIIACAGGSRELADYSEAAALQAQLTRELPPGTPLRIAEQRLRDLGFACSLLRDAAWTGREGRHTYLYGDATTGPGPVVQRWQVAVITDGESAREVLVTTGLIGP